jgi:hypothetical protein
MGVSLLEWRMVCLSNDQLTPFVFYTEKITSPQWPTCKEFDSLAGIQHGLYDRSFFSRRSVLDIPLSAPLSDLRGTSGTRVMTPPFSTT